MAAWKIKVWDGKGRYHADDVADCEADARLQAAAWTGQRGQMTWQATIYDADGMAVATFKRGMQVSK